MPVNTIDIGLAFLEGLALIVSPCILPVLPLVLATSVSGGRRRPYGIILGFVLAFTFLALVARRLVSLTGVNLDLVKDASLVLLALLGLVLLSSRLSEIFERLTQGAADAGNRLAGRRGGEEGLLGGIFIGSLIGLVWTPCAGPILAAVLVQVIRQQTSMAGNLVIFSFVAGAAVPMLLISLAGRRAMGRLGFFKRHALGVRRFFGALILSSVAYIASGANVETLFMPKGSAGVRGERLILEDGLIKPYVAPEFAEIETWLNSPPLTMAQLKGKVVLVDFWTYSCINCVRTLPYLTDWDRKYRDKGLVIVGVHSPEFEFEKKLANVEAAIGQHGIRYPVALDNRLSTWLNFNNLYWPAHYLIDRQGNVVYTHFGEGRYDVTENNIRFLLGLAGKEETVRVEGPTFAFGQTPETYLGYARAESFGGKGRLVIETPENYRFPSNLPGNEWALNGTWTVLPEKIVAGEKGAALRLNFMARKVHLVLGTASGKPVRATLRLNGVAVESNAGKDAPAGVVTIDRHTVYELIDQKVPKNGLLEIETDAPGLEAYAFTFG